MTMAGLSNDFKSDAVAKWYIEDAFSNGVVQGLLATGATSLLAGAATIAALAVPMIVIGGTGYGIWMAVQHFKGGGNGNPPEGGRS